MFSFTVIVRSVEANIIYTKLLSIFLQPILLPEQKIIKANVNILKLKLVKSSKKLATNKSLRNFTITYKSFGEDN